MDSFGPLAQANAPIAALIYTRLEPETIRVLTLLKGQRDEPIRCKLEVAVLDEAPEYEALSYVWGEEYYPAIAMFGVEMYRITENLFKALEQLRSETEDRKLWIDALCINQCDISERSQQVQYMAQIYGGARRVLAWLGPSEANCDLLFGLVRNADNAYFRKKYMEELLASDLVTFITRSLNALLARPYWRRVWVTQEILHAKKLLILWGTASTERDTLINFCLALIKDAPIPSLSKLRMLAYTFVGDRLHDRSHAALKDGDSLPVEKLLGLLRLKDCKDLRDKVYGIHSLLPAGMRRNIPIDYTAPISSVYTAATKALIERDGKVSNITYRVDDMDPLVSGRDLGLPSWAFNLAEKSLRVPFLRNAQFHASLGHAPFMRFSPGSLELRGLRLGTVQISLMSRWAEEDNFYKLRVSTFVRCAREALDEIGATPSGLPVDRPTFAATCLGGFGDRAALDLVSSGIWGEMGELDDAVDCKIGEEIAPAKGRAIFWFDPTRAGEALPGQEGSTEQEAASSFKYMGLGSRWVKPGDVICVLLGFNAPVILRPAGEHFELVCDSFIDIYMNGEALAGIDGDMESLEAFVLI